MEYWIPAGFMVSTGWLLLYGITGEYREIFRNSRIKEIFYLFRLSILTGLVLFLALVILSNNFDQLESVFAYITIHFIVSAFIKILVVSRYQNYVKKGKVNFNSLIVGSYNKANKVYQDLEQNSRHLGLQVKGFVHVFDFPKTFPENNLAHLGHYHTLPDIIKKHQIKEIIIAVDPLEHGKITEIISLLEDKKVRISLLPDVYQMLLGYVKVNHLLGTPLIEVKYDLIPIWQGITKRILDIGVSLFILVAFFWVYLVIAIMVKITSPGPIIYRQERIGRGGRPFTIYKFRSMFTGAETDQPLLSTNFDKRVTSWGRVMRKIRLDELPQFYNVLIGEMSLVGPRPERNYFIQEILKVAPHYKHLLRVRPGITSLGLVKFGYAQNIPEMIERLKYDILYIENMSLTMDLRILLFTIKVIVEGRGK